MAWSTLLSVVLLAAGAAAQTPTPAPTPSNQYGSVCAAEGGTCNCVGYIRYGSGDTWTDPYLSTGPVTCSNTIFGDPLQNVHKECRCTQSAEFGVSVTVYPSTVSDWASRPICGQYGQYSGDTCCSCNLTSTADMCSNATGCSVQGTGGTAAGFVAPKLHISFALMCRLYAMHHNTCTVIMCLQLCSLPIVWLAFACLALASCLMLTSYKIQPTSFISDTRAKDVRARILALDACCHGVTTLLWPSSLPNPTRALALPTSTSMSRGRAQ